MSAKIRALSSGAKRLLAVGAVAGLAACQQAPVTGRSQLVLISPDQADQLGVEAYKQIKARRRYRGIRP
jgi:hypothetical protein